MSPHFPLVGSGGVARGLTADGYDSSNERYSQLEVPSGGTAPGTQVYRANAGPARLLVDTRGAAGGALIVSGGLVSGPGLLTGVTSAPGKVVGARLGGTFLSWVSSGGFAVSPSGVQRLAAAMAAFDAVAGGTLHLGTVSASTAPLLLAQRGSRRPCDGR